MGQWDSIVLEAEMVKEARTDAQTTDSRFPYVSQSSMIKPGTLLNSLML